MSEHAKAGCRDPSRSILGKKLLNYICQEVYKRKPKIVEGDLYKFLDIVDDQEIMRILIEWKSPRVDLLYNSRVSRK